MPVVYGEYCLIFNEHTTDGDIRRGHAAGAFVPWLNALLKQCVHTWEYLGTGTLLIRRKDERVWLLTCMHTLFKKCVKPGNKSAPISAGVQW